MHVVFCAILGAFEGWFLWYFYQQYSRIDKDTSIILCCILSMWTGAAYDWMIFPIYGGGLLVSLFLSGIVASVSWLVYFFRNKNK